MNKIFIEDCRKGLKKLADKSVQMCVTSPPYYQLRDYGHKDQIGLEATPEMYIQELVKVFREVRRVMKDDGTLWVNIGDSYCAKPQRNGNSHSENEFRDKQKALRCKIKHETIKPKDLIGIPWMLAFALRQDGWYLRQDIIWHKPNAMPESVTDRCTKSHEYMFLLSKSRTYYFDAEAIAVPMAESTIKDKRLFNEDFSQQRRQRGYPGQAQQGSGLLKPKGEKVNRRSVWTVATKPYRDAHFAVFPQELITPCILAGSKPGDTVLDPFGGSGTTAEVSLRLDRGYIIFELFEDYLKLSKKRIAPHENGLFHNQHTT